MSPLVWLGELYSGGRLVICVVVGAIVYAVVPTGEGAIVQLTLAWVVGVAVFLGLTRLAVGDASPERARRRASRIDDRAWVITALIIAATAVSFGALGFVLEKPVTAFKLVLAGLAVVASWLFAHTTFALHYAHEYYDENKTGEPCAGLSFPGTEPPDYWDFLYYSYVVGMTCQVSDVQVTSRSMRRLTLTHGVISFFFNTGVLALAINILASAL